jgi:hypothetical protein
MDQRSDPNLNPEPYGKVAITTSHGRPLGEAVMDLPMFHGIVQESEPIQRGKLASISKSTWPILQDKIRQGLHARNQRIDQYNLNLPKTELPPPQSREGV